LASLGFDESAEAPLELAAFEHDAPAATVTHQADICPDPRHGPVVGPAWMRLGQLYVIADRKLEDGLLTCHLSSVLRWPERRHRRLGRSRIAISLDQQNDSDDPDQNQCKKGDTQ
jgi:hypothetical protein